MKSAFSGRNGPLPLLAGVVTTTLLGFLLGAGCGPTREPHVCWGGVIEADGGCAAKCDPAKCLPGNVCVNNQCTLTCTSHLDCQVNAQRCEPAVVDDTDAGVYTCQAVDLRGLGQPCPKGNECPTDMRCVSAGVGDANAYCTRDCTSDDACPGGYECGYQRDPHKVCDGTVGGRTMCGTTTEPCIDAGTLTSDGVLVQGSSYCLQRKTCLKRADCAPCQDDLDCSLTPGDRCVPLAGGKVCAQACAQDTDCAYDKHCVSGSCLPLYGACKGTGGFCSPCRYDLDCQPDFACTQLHGTEKSCINRFLPDTCSSDTDCPVAPSGRHGVCLDERVQVSSTDSVYHHCYAPFDSVNSTFSCYYTHLQNQPWPDAGP